MRLRTLILLALVAIFVSVPIYPRAFPQTSDSKPSIPLDPKICRAAIGDLKPVARSVRFLFEPSSDFPELRVPGPYDWLSKHDEAGQTFDEYQSSEHHRKTPARNVIYLMPLGEFGDQAPSVEQLRKFTETYFQMSSRLMPAVDIDPQKFGVRTNGHTLKPQLQSPILLERVGQQIPRDACCVLGITMWDLYPDAEWNYVFGQASLTNRVGVFSFARFDPEFLDEPRPEDLEKVVLLRSCRVLAHETCHMFGMHHCIYFQCVVNGANNRDEMDKTPLHLCPVCLRKLHSAIGFDLLKRERQLQSLYREIGFDSDADWTLRRLSRAVGTK